MLLKILILHLVKYVVVTVDMTCYFNGLLKVLFLYKYCKYKIRKL